MLSFCSWALVGGGKSKAVQGTAENWMSTCREPQTQALPTLQDCMLLTVSETTWMANWFRFADIRVADGVKVTQLMLLAELFLRWIRRCESSKISRAVDFQANGRKDHTLRAHPQGPRPHAGIFTHSPICHHLPSPLRAAPWMNG